MTDVDSRVVAYTDMDRLDGVLASVPEIAAIIRPASASFPFHGLPMLTANGR
jgi:hypothetical protein